MCFFRNVCEVLELHAKSFQEQLVSKTAWKFENLKVKAWKNAVQSACQKLVGFVETCTSRNRPKNVGSRPYGKLHFPWILKLTTGSLDESGTLQNSFPQSQHS